MARLGEELHHFQVYRLPSCFNAGKARQHYPLRLRKTLAELAEKFEAVHSRKIQVEHCHIRRGSFREAQRLFTAAGDRHLKAPTFDRALPQLAHARLIFDNQNMCIMARAGHVLCSVSATAGNVTTKLLPFPGPSLCAVIVPPCDSTMRCVMER